MNDDELETRLRSYRPADPPAALRAAVMAAASRRHAARRSAWGEWLATAAAVLLTMVFYWLAGHEHQRLSAVIAPLPPIVQTGLLPSDGQEPQP
jgi:type VI protein secretion system component VasF